MKREAGTLCFCSLLLPPAARIQPGLLVPEIKRGNEIRKNRGGERERERERERELNV